MAGKFSTLDQFKYPSQTSNYFFQGTIECKDSRPAISLSMRCVVVQLLGAEVVQAQIKFDGVVAAIFLVCLRECPNPKAESSKKISRVLCQVRNSKEAPSIPLYHRNTSSKGLSVLPSWFDRQKQEREWVAHQVTLKRRNEAQDVAELKTHLEEWLSKCPICYLSKKPAGHGIHQCPDVTKRDKLVKIVRSMETNIRYRQYSCCFRCGVPQSICERWEPSEDQAGWRNTKNTCQYYGVMLRSIVGMLLFGDDAVYGVSSEWTKECGGDLENDNLMFKWLGQRVEWGGIECTRMAQLFLGLARGHPGYEQEVG